MKYQVWECKIVVPLDAELPEGLDFPPRRAAILAVERAGIQVLDCFSGWGGKLTPMQKQLVDDKMLRLRQKAHAVTVEKCTKCGKPLNSKIHCVTYGSFDHPFYREDGTTSVGNGREVT
ncbi:MAG: hypothetical protein WBK76_00405 [Candidatus Saccharimonadales bacterium]